VALGPSLGGIVERLSGNPFIIFYLALGLHFIHALFLWFVIPESLLPAQMDAARRRAENKRHWYNRFNFLAPLAILAPVARKEGVAPQQALKKDWSLTWLALSYAPDSLVLGSMPYWFQYAAGKFNWTAEIVSVTLGTQSTDFLSHYSGRILHQHHWGYTSTLPGVRTAQSVTFSHCTLLTASADLRVLRSCSTHSCT
jgi:hypothetical protein